MKTTKPSLSLVGQCLAAGVLFALAAVWVLPQPARAQVTTSGDLRLQEGSVNAADGAAIYRLEVYRDDQWHTLCDDGFDGTAAVVACKQLGYTHGVFRTNLPYGLANRPIWLVDFNCAGSEARLVDCPNSALTQNCDHLEDVGVSCYGDAPPRGKPTITGTLRVDQTLTAGTSGISDEDGPANLTFTYQWLADDAEIASATSSTYTLTASEVNKIVTVQVTFTDADSNDYTLTSDPTDRVGSQAPTGVPTISGTVAVGRVLSAVTTAIVDPDGPANLTFTYQWLADDVPIAGATGATYAVTEAEQGKAIKVRVSFVDSTGYGETLPSAATAVVAAAATTAGTLRLREGGEVAEDDGRAIYRLEIYRNNQWHTLCDDGFDQTDAEVACGQLGFDQGIRRTNLPYFLTSAPIWAIDLNCAGFGEPPVRLSPQCARPRLRSSR